MTIEEFRDWELKVADAVQDFRSAIYERLEELGYDFIVDYKEGSNPEIDELLEMARGDF